MKLRRNNEYMFQVVECNTYMKRIKDGNISGTLNNTPMFITMLTKMPKKRKEK